MANSEDQKTDSQTAALREEVANWGSILTCIECRDPKHGQRFCECEKHRADLEKDLDALIAAVRREALLEAAKEFCQGCESGLKPYKNGDGTWQWFHGEDEQTAFCDAAPLHELISEGDSDD